MLTVASSIAANSLNPALGGSSDPQQFFFELGYDTLIGVDTNGKYVPGLATKWGYVGKGSRVFDITLRSGVKFNDGSKLTAKGVKNSLEYYAKAGGPLASNLSTVGSIDVLSSLKLRLHLKTANPMMPFYLSRHTTGEIISPIGLQNPGDLGTTTHGAGQYMIDKSKTITGNTYTYIPNPEYFDKSRVKWKKVVVKVMKNENATLAALRSGEADYALGDPTTAKAAKSAGFQVQTTPTSVVQLQIQDREGKMVKALGDVRVRRAMLHGINRSAVASSLFGRYAKGWSASVVKGQSGYFGALSTRYDYDVKKAKRLLAEAGYPKGFTMPIIVNLTGVGETQAAEAFAAEMSNIGIKVKINIPANVNDLYASYAKYPAMMFNYASVISPPYVQGNDWLYSWANPLKMNDPQLDSRYTEAAGAPTAEAQEKGWEAFEDRISALAWNIPMFAMDKIVYARPGLDGINLSTRNPNPALTQLYAAK